MAVFYGVLVFLLVNVVGLLFMPAGFEWVILWAVSILAGVLVGRWVHRRTHRVVTPS